MSSLYKKRVIYYLSVRYKGQRSSVSLGTRNKDIAKKIRKDAEAHLLLQLLSFKKPSVPILFSNLVDIFLNAEHDWSHNTRLLYKNVLRSYRQERDLPDNITSRCMWRRCINTCLNWGKRNGYRCTNLKKMEGRKEGPPRLRVFSESEIKKILHNTHPQHFRLFIQLAYYTGARAGELRKLTIDDIQGSCLLVRGKTGERLVKLSKQGKDVHNLIMDSATTPYLFSTSAGKPFSRHYVTKTFTRNMQKLGIPNARFHDLRRSFGYYLIKQGRPIYEVSKLLGHTSVTTTERHYAPLLTTEIEDFKL